MNPTTDAIWQMVMANKALLESCPKHDFSIPLDRRTKEPIPHALTFCDWRCSRCRGWVDGTARHWYNLGLEHGKI